jgi:hypothetical protein
MKAVYRQKRRRTQVDKIQDPVFGQMEVKHGWQKKELLQFWKNTVSFKVKAAQYGNKEITDIQRINYRYVIDNIEMVAQKAQAAITEYMAINKDSILPCLPQSVSYLPENLVVPRTLIFYSDGQFGILFDCEWDREHGLAVNLKDYTVGPQDMFL